jgi:hypothetical protein
MHPVHIRMLFAMLAALAVTIAMPSVAFGGKTRHDNNTSTARVLGNNSNTDRVVSGNSNSDRTLYRMARR